MTVSYFITCAWGVLVIITMVLEIIFADIEDVMKITCFVGSLLFIGGIIAMHVLESACTIKGEQQVDRKEIVVTLGDTGYYENEKGEIVEAPIDNVRTTDSDSAYVEVVSYKWGFLESDAKVYLCVPCNT